MAETSLRTFISIFDEDIQSICIPMIQRDYAQGRTSNQANLVRSRFLDALHHALTTDENITLDFVYGEIESGGVLVPLDGQQRLTTLFLLHWYIAKHESIDPSETEFLKKFTYDTRYSAREFCALLSDYEPDFSLDAISADIRDQYWYPLDWDNDPTIAAMLVMIDSIHALFRETSGLWDRLSNGAISFYFLPLKEMGLTDELYIKMNSRGKPLTQFEHFKAEFEGAMKSIDVEIATRISSKIDLEWTDMLWPYKGDNEIIDDEFLRYFRFISDILCYKSDRPLIEDPFNMIKEHFSTDNASAKGNLLFVEKLFDCWCNRNIDELFDRFLTIGGHEDSKSIVGKMTNLFLDCCNVYGEMQSGRIRKYPIGRSILLYAFIQYLLNEESVTEAEFIRRLRSINNMVRASEFELRDDRMQALLSQTEEVILTGVVNESDKSFKTSQVLEEKQKMEWLVDNADKELLMRESEDHNLLQGAVRVLGIDNIDLFPRFKQLFELDWDLVNRALLAVGDYSRYINWRYQIGSSAIWTVWRDMFNVAEPDMANTQLVLRQLLNGSEDMTEAYLNATIDSYLQSSPAKDWRYYIVYYKSMRPARYGMYRWGQGHNGKVTRTIYAMTTEKSTSGYNYNIFLKTIYDSLKADGIEGLHLGNYAYQHDGDRLYFDNENMAMASDETCFTIYRKQEDGSLAFDSTIPITQNEDDTVDMVDRVQLGIDTIKNWQGTTQPAIEESI